MVNNLGCKMHHGVLFALLVYFWWCSICQFTLKNPGLKFTTILACLELKWNAPHKMHQKQSPWKCYLLDLSGCNSIKTCSPFHGFHWSMNCREVLSKYLAIKLKISTQTQPHYKICQHFALLLYKEVKEKTKAWHRLTLDEIIPWVVNVSIMCFC